MSDLGTCCVDPGAKQTHDVQGNEEEIAGVNTYKIGNGTSAIVVFTDIFGYSFVNTRKLADRFAQSTGSTVLIPDCFNDDSISPDAPDVMGILPAWLQKHPPTVTCKLAEKFVVTIKEDYQSIQLIGFCYGARPVIHLISHAELSSSINSAVVAHPAFLAKEKARQIQRPILFLCAENDFIFTPAIRQEFEKELKHNGLGTFVDYPGTVHGFVVRPHGFEEVFQQRDKAVEDAIQYLKKNLSTF